MKFKKSSIVSASIFILFNFVLIIGFTVDPSNRIVRAASSSSQSPDEAGRAAASSNEVVVKGVFEPVDGPGRWSDGWFIDDLNAWVFGSGYPRRTTDGGRTWEQLRPADDAKYPDKWSPGVYLTTRFPTPERGWLLGNGTWQTDDGGLTWRKIFSKSADGPFFSSEATGFMSLGIDDDQEQSYITKDGGMTWTPCGSPRSYADFSVGMAAYFLTPEIGWAVSTQEREGRTLYVVAKTEDGGCSWKLIWDNPDLWSERMLGIFFLNEGRLDERRLYRQPLSHPRWRKNMAQDESPAGPETRRQAEGLQRIC